MLLTPTFQVYLGDFYQSSSKFGLISDTLCNGSLILNTFIFYACLQNLEVRAVAIASLFFEFVSYIFSCWVFSENKADWYWGGLMQAACFDTTYKCLMWLPAYIVVTKLIPADVEVVMDGVIKTF